MRVSVIGRDDRSPDGFYELPEASSVMDLMKLEGLLPDATLAARDDRIIPCDEVLKDGDSITFFRVASGG